VVYLEAMHMPERILAPETATYGLNVRALLNSTLAIAYRHLLQPEMMLLKKGALPFKMLFANNIHDSSFD
jgi:hypothetical protein